MISCCEGVLFVGLSMRGLKGLLRIGPLLTKEEKDWMISEIADGRGFSTAHPSDEDMAEIERRYAELDADKIERERKSFEAMLLRKYGK